MRFELALVSSDIYLGNIDLLDTHLDFLDTYIPSMPFFSLQDVLTWRHPQDMPSKLLQDISSRHVFKTSWRRLQRNSFLSSKMSSRRIQDVFKTSWKMKYCYAKDVLMTLSGYVLKMSWRRLDDQ